MSKNTLNFGKLKSDMHKINNLAQEKSTDITQNKQMREKNGKAVKSVLTFILSVTVGAINGLFGGGGGILVVPLFTLCLGLDEKRAHSSAILTILPLSLVSGIIYLVRGDFTLYSGGFVTAGVILGGILGTFVMKKLSNNVLAIVFYAVMIFAGISSLVGALNR